jgi:AcrR family transcriptional regulator
MYMVAVRFAAVLASNLTGSIPSGRRSQAERSAATRAKILSAALEALGQVGYTQMRLSDVARSVSISNGALSHHFPQKANLALAALTEGERLVLRTLRQRVDEAQVAPDRDRRIFDALYEVHSGIEFQAFLSVQAHARSHDELGPGMTTIIERATGAMRDIAADGWGPEIQASPRFQDFIGLTLATVRGLVIIAGIRNPGDSTNPDIGISDHGVWPEGRRLLLRRLEEIRAERDS